MRVRKDWRDLRGKQYCEGLAAQAGATGAAGANAIEPGCDERSLYVKYSLYIQCSDSYLH
jgi:hypothetical protein